MANLIIFDCDGVLINSERLTLIEEIDFVQRHTFLKFSVNDYINKFTGLTKDEWIKSINELRYSQNLTAIPTEEFDRFILETDKYIRENISLIPGIKSFLNKLNKPFIVASNNSKENLSFMLKKTGLDKYFQFNVFSADVVGKGKPEPDLLIYISQKMNCHPSNCVVVEDSINGIIAAKKAGMKVIGYIGDSMVSAETMLKYGADGIIESFLVDLDSSIHNLLFSD